MTTETINELKTLASDVKIIQIENAVGSSWTALAVEEDLQTREVGTLLVEARAEGGGGHGAGGGIEQRE